VPVWSLQMLVLAHLYAKTDSASLAVMRAALQRKRYTAAEVGVGAGIAVSLTAGQRFPAGGGTSSSSWALCACCSPAKCLCRVLHQPAAAPHFCLNHCGSLLAACRAIRIARRKSRPFWQGLALHDQ